MNKKLWKEAANWSLCIAAAIIMVLLMNMYVIQMYKVDGESMSPTFRNHEYLLISKLDRSFSHQDIVVIDSRIDRKPSFLDRLRSNSILSGNVSHLWIKRIIGMPGDELEFRDGALLRNGSILDEPYLREAMAGVPDARFIVQDNYVFVMGDNRNNSLDSRMIGPVPFSHVIGKTAFLTDRADRNKIFQISLGYLLLFLP
ncbi:signal peptidase I [Paenibacillus mesophilus]|uniref:signal peptidase I n=1 Tax=Paenibacillus mesophilus TaxID=2582849 RepID=UPI0013050BC7|nr:signal peptidase I [Paenibacillus mesophilus]